MSADEFTKRAKFLGRLCGTNFCEESRLPEAGYCRKHEHFSLTVEFAIPHPTGLFVKYICPECYLGDVS